MNNKCIHDVERFYCNQCNARGCSKCAATHQELTHAHELNKKLQTIISERDHRDAKRRQDMKAERGNHKAVVERNRKLEAKLDEARGSLLAIAKDPELGVSQVVEQLEAEIKDLKQVCEEKQQVIEAETAVRKDLHVYRDEYEVVKQKLAESEKERNLLLSALTDLLDHLWSDQAHGNLKLEKNTTRAYFNARSVLNAALDTHKEAGNDE